MFLYDAKELAYMLKTASQNGHWVFTCGNGGSAATAEHFSNDLFKKGIKTICLNSNTSIMTMIANDFGYEYVFSKQLEVMASQDDYLVLFSCSGKSENLVETLNIDINRIPIFGGDGSYGDIENQHLKYAHEICEFI